MCVSQVYYIVRDTRCASSKKQQQQHTNKQKASIFQNQKMFLREAFVDVSSKIDCTPLKVN